VPHFELNALSLLLAQMAAIMAVSRALGFAFRWIGQPLVIAEVTAGIVLGPSLLGWIWPELKATLFPPDSMGVLRMFSQLGLVLFMFLVGLEVDPLLLRGRGRASLAISHSSILVPFVLGFAATWWLRERYADPAVPFLSLALFMGVAMSITAFPVLARILSERHLLGSRLGSISIACAAMNDILGWCLLAFVVAQTRATGMGQAIWTTALAVAFVLAMLFLVRPLLTRVAARVSGREGLTPSMVVGALLLLLASAWTTEIIGIHALFGAFVAGAVLPNEGGLVTALAERLESVAVALLLPLFFAYSGLRTEIGLLTEPSDWLAAGIIIAIATAGKFGGSFVAARTTGSPWREAAAIGVLMNTRGLMELIVLNIGLDLGVISPALFTLMVLMALATTIATTPVLRWIYPEAEQIREQAPAEAAWEEAAPFSLLMCVSDARSGPAMANLAAGLAGEQAEASRLYALHLAPPSDRPSSELRPGGMLGGESALGPLIRRAGELRLGIRPLVFVSSDPGADIARTADVVQADLVVLGWHRPLFAEGRLGGVVRDVLNRTRPHVAVLVDRGLTDIHRIMVAFAGTPEDVESLRIAKRLASLPGADVTLLHVVDPGKSGAKGPGRTQIGELMGASETQAGNVRLKVVEHASAEQAALDETAAGYDLVIVAMSREWGIERKGLAFRRERLLAESTASVLAVRPGHPRPGRGAKRPSGS
jgi:Kef-type K+ transport system membrane component KefB/nucleotide-binding universal stress UspA family protein